MFDLVHHKVLHSFHGEHARFTFFYFIMHARCTSQYIRKPKKSPVILDFLLFNVIEFIGSS